MADVIIYDGLVNKTLLDLKNENAVLVDGSKRAGKGCREQESINEMMLRHAAAGKIVCRLKGGDPFVFGRGGEEALFLKNNNVSFEIVSGVTSAVAALAYAGIPITHRDHCSNFQVITGHENPLKTDSRLSWKNLAQNMGTLVFLMSSARLTDISNRLIEHGKLASTPVALISKGTLPDQTVVITTLKEAASGTNIHLEGVRRPALFVVGDVVKLREELNWFH